MKGNPQVQVELILKPDIESALKYWEELSDKFNNDNPFLTLNWFSSWLKSIETIPSLALLREDQQVIGICFVGEKIHKRYGMSIKTAYVNQSGNQKFDQTWIEYNGLLCKENYEAIFFQLLFKRLSKCGYDRLFISMANSPPSFLSKSPKDTSITVGYVASLETAEADFMQSILSRNSRSQITRSNKKIKEAYGELKLTEVNNTFQRKQALSCLGNLHIQRWKNTIHGSGFENKYFKSQLDKLITEAPEFANILELKAGTTTIGYSLNFIFNKSVYFYCSGINFSIATKHIKPGYTMHFLMMKHYARLGFRYYDFLAGEARYKSSLSDKKTIFFSTSFPLATPMGRLISLYYRLKSLVSKK
jgi:hypothetical protein